MALGRIAVLLTRVGGGGYNEEWERDFVNALSSARCLVWVVYDIPTTPHTGSWPFLSYGGILYEQDYISIGYAY